MEPHGSEAMRQWIHEHMAKFFYAPVASAFAEASAFAKATVDKSADKSCEDG